MKHEIETLGNFAIKKVVGAFVKIACTIVFAQMYNMAQAKACRDCPFPTPISKLHWRMPGGYSEVMVDEINIGSGRIQSVVRLLDAMTGELLAIGQLEHTKGRKRITVLLHDMSGGSIETELYYTNVGRDKVRIKITCEKCNLKPAYFN